MMRQFAESRTCRGQALLTYFGDRLDRPVWTLRQLRRRAPRRARCRNRTRTDGADTRPPLGARPQPIARRRPTADATPYPLHATVRHKSWGTGTVLGYEADRMTVLFSTVGYKTLDVAVVRRGNLLQLEPD